MTKIKNQDNETAEIEFQYNDSATIKGYQDNSSATIEAGQYNHSATIKGDQDNTKATIEGDQDNGSATIEGNIYIKDMKNGSEETQKLLDKFNKEHNWGEATFDNFVKWLIKRGKQKEKKWYYKIKMVIE